MNYQFSELPKVYGGLHLAFVALTIVFNIALYRITKDKQENYLLKLLWALGLIMVAAEIFKQWFCYIYIYDRRISLIYFPWQLCSIAMYLSVAARYLKGRAQEGALVYLSTFSLLGAVMALAYPEGMLLREIAFTIHSFIYHTLIISESIIAIMILKKRKQPASFSSSLPLFAITVLIADMINILARYIIGDPRREPDMFYINPYYTTTQPVFHDIAINFGNITETIIYLICIVLAAYLIFLAEHKR